MSDLSRSLRREMSGRFLEQNPLVIFGISPDVLDLGLKPEALQDYIVKDVARRLVMRFHPDNLEAASTPGAVELQLKYAQAYKELQDPEKFQQALLEFRNTKSREKGEVRLLRRALADLRTRLNSNSMHEDDLRHRLAEASRFESSLKKREREMELVVPSLRSRIEEWHRANQSLAKQAYNLRRSNAGLVRYFSSLAMPPDFLPGSKHLLETRWVVFASFVPSLGLSVPLPNAANVWTDKFLRVVKRMKLSEGESAELLRRWQDSYRLFAESPGRVNPKALWRLQVVSVMRGMASPVFAGENKPVGGMMVLGSIRPEGLTVREFERRVSRDVLYHRISVFLSPGDLLVSAKPAMSTSPRKRHIGLTNHFRLETRSLILAVK